MGVLANAAVKLGDTLAKFGCEALTGSKLAGDVAGGLVATLGGHATSEFDRRRIHRNLESIADTVAERVRAHYGAEFRGLDEPARAVVIEAVADSFAELSPLTDLALRTDLQAADLAALVRKETGELLRSRYFSQDETCLYDLVLDLAAAEAVRIVTGLSSLANLAVPELLTRLTALDKQVREAPARALAAATAAGEAAFARTYRDLAVTELTRADLHHERLTRTSRRYPLDPAYLPIPVLCHGVPISLEAVVRNRPRLILAAPLGAGKTTLLHQLFTRIARRSLPEYPDTLPFYLSLHRYSPYQQPELDHLLTTLGQDIAGEMPSGWLQRQLREGDSLVLLDHLDRVPAEDLPTVLDWIEKLSARFPQARCVLATRPGVLPPDWAEAAGFSTAELPPLSATHSRAQIQRWHAAVLAQVHDPSERAWITEAESRLLQALAGSHPLRQLARNPLTCTLMCALHRDRLVRLPDSWADLLRMIIEFLADERDRTRRMPNLLGLPRERHLRILADLAYWMTTEELDHAEYAETRIRVYHAGGGSDPRLLTRTGLLQLDHRQRVSFPAPVLRDYLAAREIIDGNHLRALARTAPRYDRHQLALMVAGQLPLPRAKDLMRLLSQDHRNPADQPALSLLSQACLHLIPDLPAEHRNLLPFEECLSPGLLAELPAHAEPLVVDTLARFAGDHPSQVFQAAYRLGEEAWPLLDLLRDNGSPVRENVMADQVRGGGAGD